MSGVAARSKPRFARCWGRPEWSVAAVVPALSFAQAIVLRDGAQKLTEPAVNPENEMFSGA